MFHNIYTFTFMHTRIDQQWNNSINVAQRYQNNHQNQIQITKTLQSTKTTNKLSKLQTFTNKENNIIANLMVYLSTADRTSSLLAVLEAFKQTSTAITSSKSSVLKLYMKIYVYGKGRLHTRNKNFFLGENGRRNGLWNSVLIWGVADGGILQRDLHRLAHFLEKIGTIPWNALQRMAIGWAQP